MCECPLCVSPLWSECSHLSTTYTTLRHHFALHTKCAESCDDEGHGLGLVMVVFLHYWGTLTDSSLTWSLWLSSMSLRCLTDWQLADEILTLTSDWLMPAWFALCHHTGSTSPCNSDEENKAQKFIDKSTVLSLTLLTLLFFVHENGRGVSQALMCCVVLFLFCSNHFSSEVQKQTLFQDGFQWLRYCMTAAKTSPLLSPLSLPRLLSPWLLY